MHKTKIVYLLGITLICLISAAACSDQPDLSYEHKVDQIILYADVQPIASPLLPNTTCQFDSVPLLRVWGDGLVFLVMLDPQSSLLSGKLTAGQIKDILISLRATGFFNKDFQIDNTGGVNPAGTWFRMGIHLKKQNVEHSSGILSPGLYNNIINKIVPSLTPFTIDKKPDSRFGQLNIGTRECAQTN